jgi:hypothetical protein
MSSPPRQDHTILLENGFNPTTEMASSIVNFEKSNSLPIYQLKLSLPFALLLINTFLPPLDFSLAKNPCRRFCTRRLGLYVSRFAPRKAEAEKGRVDDDAGVEEARSEGVPGGNMEEEERVSCEAMVRVVVVVMVER